MLLHDIATRAATQQRLSEQTPQRQRFILKRRYDASRALESLVFLFRQVFGGHDEIAFFITPIFFTPQTFFFFLFLLFFGILIFFYDDGR
jgi:hypothetical protein